MITNMPINTTPGVYTVVRAGSKYKAVIWFDGAGKTIEFFKRDADEFNVMAMMKLEYPNVMFTPEQDFQEYIDEDVFKKTTNFKMLVDDIIDTSSVNASEPRVSTEDILSVLNHADRKLDWIESKMDKLLPNRRKSDKKDDDPWMNN